MSKATVKQNVRHLKERFLERFGFDVTRTTRDKLIAQIKSGDSIAVRAISRTRTVHRVLLEEVPYFVIYNKMTHQIATVLPRDSHDEVRFNKQQRRFTNTEGEPA